MPTKTIDGTEHHASDFAYVGDANDPSTWKLPIFDAAHAGAAIAALGKGFRGKKVSLPAGARAGAVAKVKSAWLKFHPDKTAADFPLGETGDGAAEESAAPASDPIPLIESFEFEGDWEALVETKVRRDGTVPVKLIRPGWGSSGYYPTSTLERDAAIFEGARMFWNHPRPSEDAERPERDLNDLAAVVQNVHFEESGASGAGIYGDAKVFSPYRERVEELAPYIGVSILASGQGTKGEAEGKKGLIIEAITHARSVDFVTQPGAGGEILSLFESAPLSDAGEEVNDVEMKEAQARIDELTDELKEAQADAEQAHKDYDALSEAYAALKKSAILTEAKEFVADKLEATDLPEAAQARILDALTSDPTVSTEDGEVRLDTDVLAEAIDLSVKAESEYIASLTEDGSIRGMGDGDNDESDPAEAEAQLVGAFESIGLTESAAKEAARGR